MTIGLLISRRRKIELHKKALRNHEHTMYYRSYRNIYNAVLKQSKKLYIEENFKNYKGNPKKTWDFLKRTTFGEVTKQKISELKDNDKSITDNKTMANMFNNFFSTIGTKIVNDLPTVNKDPLSYIPDYDQSLPMFYFDIPGPVHICDVVKSFENKSSPDLDDLSLKFVKKIISEISVFRISLETGVFPEKLKTSRVVPIFKSGDPQNCDNYRPITLVSTLSKILEKIVAIRLTNHLQLNNLIFENQFGFQRNMSTEHNLLKVVNFISSALNNGNHCIGIFLDLKKAFDVCSHDILLKKLLKYGLDGSHVKWFKSYLSNRIQKVDINGQLSDEKMLNISVLQGTILGPILFLIYINDLPFATKLCLFLFADDTSGLAEGKNLNDLILFVNAELKKLANWCNKMAINISKTKYILFRTKGKKISNPPPVIFDNN
jgi:hypothetical protein